MLNTKVLAWALGVFGGVTFLYGAYGGLVFGPLYNAFARRWGGGERRDSLARPAGHPVT